MKRVIIAVVALALTTASGVYAETFTPVTIQENGLLKDKTPVKPEDLPQPIKTVLADQFKDWEVTTAFYVTEDGTEYYEVNITKGPDRQTVKFDKDGKILNP